MNPQNQTEQEIYAGKPVSAVVYIWYPCQKFRLGHTAINIGGVPLCPWPMGFAENPISPNPAPPTPRPVNEKRDSTAAMPSKHERSLSMCSIFSRGAGTSTPPYTATERDWPLAPQNHPPPPGENNYVSFLADIGIQRGIISVAGVLSRPQDDFIVIPHLTYYLIDLDVKKMQQRKNKIYHTETYGNTHWVHSYNPINKNCATIVAKILKAGGVESFLNTPQKIGYGRNLYWTPKDIAQLCNELRNNGKAVKIREIDCPSKWDSPFKTLMGFR